MAIEMSYDDVMDDVQKGIDDKSLVWTCKDKKTKVTLRPMMLIPDPDLKVVLVLIKALGEIDDTDFEKRIETVDRILVAVADKKDAFKKDMADIPAEKRIEIFQAWSDADSDQGEASDSES